MVNVVAYLGSLLYLAHGGVHDHEDIHIAIGVGLP